MKLHDLKTWPAFFADIVDGKKTFELRRDDRGYREGDTLCLREYDPGSGSYSGREVYREVTHVLRHDPEAGCAATFGLGPEFVIMSIRPDGQRS